MSKKIDLRVIKTKRAIKQAFLTLIKEKNYNKITVQDIVREALINRNTFYLHYLDKDDLLDSLTNECFEKLEASMNSHEEVSGIQDLSYDAFKEINIRIFKAIEEEFELYQVILGDDSIPYLALRFSKVIKNHIGGGITKKRAFFIEYIVAGFVGVVRLWIKDPGKYTIEDITELLTEVYSTDMIQLLRSC